MLAFLWFLSFSFTYSHWLLFCAIAFFDCSIWNWTVHNIFLIDLMHQVSIILNFCTELFCPAINYWFGSVTCRHEFMLLGSLDNLYKYKVWWYYFHCVLKSGIIVLLKYRHLQAMWSSDLLVFLFVCNYPFYFCLSPTTLPDVCHFLLPLLLCFTVQDERWLSAERILFKLNEGRLPTSVWLIYGMREG